MKLKYLLLTLLLSAVVFGAQAQLLQDFAAAPRREVRAVWLTTLSGLDWPSRPATDAAGERRQREELDRILDRLQATGVNTVIYQARIRGTVTYPSALEPWDICLTGRYGRAPGYDPLAYAVEQCHRRGMELHAWVVAFPVCKLPAVKALGAEALPRRHPELCRRSGDQWMMDPGVPATGDYIAELCAEIVRKYEVDGVHLDYIRYPENSLPWDDRDTFRKYGAGRPLAQWRRDNVTAVVRKVHDAVKAVRPWVKLSCSPVGKYADLPRQSSYGWNARDAVSQDAQGWLRDGLMDILFPMMYFDGRHFYPFAQDWQENAAGRLVVPGLGIYFLSPREKDWPLGVVERQMYFTRQLGMGGQAFFRSRFFTDNVKGLYDFTARSFWKYPVPLPPMTWADSVAPATPQIAVERRGHVMRMSWQAVKDDRPEVPVSYSVYRLEGDGARWPDDAIPLARGLRVTSYEYVPVTSAAFAARHVVTAVDAYGNESLPDTAGNVREQLAAPAGFVAVVDGYVALPQWAAGENICYVADMAGRVVARREAAGGVDVRSLAPGLYELQASDGAGGRRTVLRFSKQ